MISFEVSCCLWLEWCRCELVLILWEKTGAYLGFIWILPPFFTLTAVYPDLTQSQIFPFCSFVWFCLFGFVAAALLFLIDICRGKQRTGELQMYHWHSGQAAVLTLVNDTQLNLHLSSWVSKCYGKIWIPIFEAGHCVPQCKQKATWTTSFRAEIKQSPF